MVAKRTKGSSLRAAALIGLTSAAASACDAEVPTALEDGLADPGAVADADGSNDPVSNALRTSGTLGSPDFQPLVFVDGVEVTKSSDSDNQHSLLSALDPDNIDRIEVVKGAAAVESHGERAEQGVIQIYTKDPNGA